MSPYQGRRVFRTATWVLIATTVAELIVVAGLLYHLRTVGMGARTWVFAGLTGFGALGIAEGLRRRIILGDDALHVIDLFTRRSIPRDEIVSVTAEKGSPIALKLADGKWAKLPDLGHNSLGVTNSIRAWVKAG